MESSERVSVKKEINAHETGGLDGADLNILKHSKYHMTKKGYIEL